MYRTIYPELRFSQAAERWLNARAVSIGPISYLAPRTVRDLHQYIRALSRKFGRVRLKNITIRKIREYQAERAQTCGPTRINQELGCLVQVLKRGNAWSDELQRCYEPLRRQYSDPRRAMTPEEQERFLATAAQREQWGVVHDYALLALSTTASSAEMRGLHISDIDLRRRLLKIRKDHAKNRYRIRTIPLNDQAAWAANRLIERAMALGARSPDHYLLPFRSSPDRWDPERPMSNSGIRKPWESLRRAAGVAWLRVHDLRHTAITRMAEAGVPIPVIMGLAGHVSAQMYSHYTSVSLAAKWLAVQSLSATSSRNKNRALLPLLATKHRTR